MNSPGTTPGLPVANRSLQDSINLFAHRLVWCEHTAGRMENSLQFIEHVGNEVAGVRSFIDQIKPVFQDLYQQLTDMKQQLGKVISDLYPAPAPEVPQVPAADDDLGLHVPEEKPKAREQGDGRKTKKTEAAGG